MVPKLRKMDYQGRLETLDLMPTDVRRARGDMIKTFKIMKGRMGIGRDIMETTGTNRTRGHDMKLIVNRSRTEIRRNFLFFTRRVCGGWNDLGQEVINTTTVETFKRAYDRHKKLTKRGGAKST